jgi:glycosyltransferase involved in cell wall biosynthesis
MPGPIDVVLPVHNEAESIERTLTEFYQVVAVEAGIPIRFVICEDGSADNTVEVLTKCATKFPLHLISDQSRKGYSRAVLDGFRATSSDLIGFIDSDGQCDPRDFTPFLQAIDSGDCDLAFGYRNPRHDHWIRKTMSSAFGLLYRCFFSIPVRDPSCPFLLIRRESLERVLRGNPGILKEGFWWEFIARCAAAKLRIREIPIRHRPRTAGVTQVYRPAKILSIARQHIRGLFTLKRELDTLL